LIVNVTEHQIMPIVVQEPPRLFREHLVVERLREPSDLGNVCLGCSSNANIGAFVTP
jgi:hypothetical protein